jgi:hypothetical protein
VKRLAYGAWMDFATGSERENWSVGGQLSDSPNPDLLVLPKQGRHTGAKRNKPTLVELRLANHQQASVQIDVPEPKVADFADP